MEQRALREELREEDGQGSLIKEHRVF